MAKSINITIPEKELMKAKTKQGVYSERLKHRADFAKVLGARTITTAIIPIIELAFREYAHRHGCKPTMENTEWDRFRTVLDKYL